jgi:hypothetical protein
MIPFSALLVWKNDCHLAEPLGAHEFKSFEDIRFVFDEQFGTRRDAESALTEEDFPDLAANAGLGELLFDLLNFWSVGRREQHLHKQRKSDLLYLRPETVSLQYGERLKEIPGIARERSKAHAGLRREQERYGEETR